MVKIEELEKVYSRTGVTNKIYDHLKNCVGVPISYGDLSNIVGVPNNSNFRVLIMQLAKAGKVNRGYKDSKAYVYIEKVEE